MTDGTSQGLFIVVAIVIFGIFTLMAYILFEDTLSPALASMFTDATNVSQDKLNKHTTDERFFKIDTEGKLLAYADFDTSDNVELPLDVVIPRTVNGITVKTIGSQSFTDKGLTSVKIPNSVKTIEDSPTVYTGAFKGNKLKILDIPGSVEYIGHFAFMNAGVEDLTLNEGLLTVGSHAFTSNNLNKLKLPDSIQHIASYSFTACNLTDIDLGKGLLEIGDFAFTSNMNLKTVRIPSSVNKVGVMSFKDSYQLNELLVTEEFKNKLIAAPEFLVSRAGYTGGKFVDKIYFPQSILKTY